MLKNQSWLFMDGNLLKERKNDLALETTLRYCPFTIQVAQNIDVEIIPSK